MRLKSSLWFVYLFTLLSCASAPKLRQSADLAAEVTQTERAFAQSMKDRNYAAFTRFLSQEAIFFSGPTPLHGKDQVVSFWKRFFEQPEAPFSWEPKTIEVLNSGTLALSTGPVYDPQGKLVSTFTSIWRQEEPGVWRIIFDKGNKVCESNQK